jgi:hypothetical protein
MNFKQSSKYLTTEDNNMRQKSTEHYDKLPESVKKKVSEKTGNNSGLPDALKSGIESLSGFNLDDVRVHYNSNKPATLQAHAYSQGNDIHLGSGQEKHLPHEAWHIVQQKQGRVKPTIQMDDSAALEKEADMMGAKAARLGAK